MAFPTVEATATSQNNTATTGPHTVTLPSGIVAGDLLVILIRTGVPSATGWTVDASNRVMTRTADGSEGASVAVTSGSAARMVAIAYRISGWTAFEISSLPSSIDPPSFSPAWGADDTLWIATATATSSDWTFTTAPTNYGSLLETGNPSNSATSRSRIAAATRSLNASSDDPDAFAVSGGTQTSPLAFVVTVQGVAAGGNTPRMALLGVG